MLEISVAAALWIAFVIAAFVSVRRRLHFINPATAFSGVWAVLCTSYFLHLINLYPILPTTWFIVGGAALAYLAGAGLASFMSGGSRRSVGIDALSINHAALKRLVTVLYVLGLLSFSAYLVEIELRLGIQTLFLQPWVLRIALGNYEFTWFAKYYYFTVPASGLAVIHLKVSGRQRRLMVWIVVTCLVLSIATTGRASLIQQAIWLSFIILYASPSKRTLPRLSTLALQATMVAVLVGLFIAAGNWMGKTFRNSYLATTTDVEDSFSSAVIPYFYFTAGIPSFQNELAEPLELGYGANTFLPVAKLCAAALRREDPSEISEFTKVPYPSNTYTYLEPYFRDFGIPGALVLPFFLGLGSMYVYLRMVRLPSVALILTSATICRCILFTFGTNNFVSPFVWWMILVGALAGQACRRHDEVAAMPARCGGFQSGPVLLAASTQSRGPK